MFVRFRERANDAREPQPFLAVRAKRLCTGRCLNRQGQRISFVRMGKGCPESPRCHWRVAGERPYRLLVSLIETRRIQGKVHQEHIADLGAIDGIMLAGFYADLDAAAEARPDIEHWQAKSTIERLVFWDRLEAKLAQLANRLDEKQADEVRDRIEERIPRPTPEEITALELWRWQSTGKGYRSMVAGDQRHITRLLAQIDSLREGIALIEPIAGHIEQQSEKVRRGEGASPELRDTYSNTLGKILANRSGASRPR